MKEIILVIDDEMDLLDLLEIRLGALGFEVIGCLNTKMAQKFLNEEKISLIIADRNLKGEDGAKFIKKIRKDGFFMPVIILSALDSKEDKIKGFSALCDDYITKPFDFDLLVLKIKALLMRQNGLEENVLSYKNLSLDTKSRILVLDDNEQKHLTKLEAKLLILFFKNPNKILKKDFLLESVWNNEQKEKGISVAIKRLRKKLAKDNNKYIRNIRQEGYILV